MYCIREFLSFFIFYNIFSKKRIKISCFVLILPMLIINGYCAEHVPKVRKQEREAINEVAHLLVEQTAGKLKIGPGCCLSCGAYCDIESSHATVKKAGETIKRYTVSLVLKIPWPDSFSTSHDCLSRYIVF